MLPEAFCKKMQSLLGDEYEAFLQGYDKTEFHGLRLNPLKSCAKSRELIQDWCLKSIPWTKTGYYYDSSLRPGKHPYHEAGAYYIQEPSAMTPGEMLDAQPGDYVLDLCSAPGGKATQLAGQMLGEGILICNEIVPNRAKILSENIERMGVRNAIVTSEDPDTLAEHFPEYFDRIMVDAPCSGEGMFRKNTDAQTEWSPENVEICWKRQDDILNAAAQMLVPGGRMVFSTCTFSPEENEGSMQRFLDSHPDFHLIPACKCEGMADGRPEWAYYHENSTSSNSNNDSAVNVSRTGSLDLTGTIRLWPHLIDGEGHYTAILERDGVPTDKEDRMSPKNLEKGIKEKSLGEYLSFEKDILKVHFEGVYLKFGDNLYVAPNLLPSLKGLKVLRPGLHLGTELKGRFEPSHALALALRAEDVASSVSINLDTASKFISGESFPCKDKKGWTLIEVDGFSLGWGKASNGTMKNHYPKGLRTTYLMF